MYKTKIIAIVITVMQLGLTACGDTTSRENNSSVTPIIPTFQAASSDTGAAVPNSSNGPVPGNTATFPGSGSFNLSFGLSTALPDSTLAVNTTRATQIDRQLSPSILAVNDVVGLPGGDVPIVIRQCDLANAFYVSNVREIVMCTELLDAAFNALLGLFDLDITRASRVAGQVFTFFMLHEMAHALDDVLELPVFGNTESAADAIATVLAIETGLPDIVLFSAYLFTLSGDGTFGDVHYAGEDRAGDLVCWVLGSDPSLLTAEGFSELGQQFVDAGRDCVGEYAEQRTAVERWIPRLSDLDASQQLALKPFVTQQRSAADEAGAFQDLTTILNQLNLPRKTPS